MTPHDVLSRLHHVQQNAKGWVALCPAHEDRSRSLSVARGRREGYILLHCFAGCDRGAILAQLGLPDEPARPAPYVAPPVDEDEARHRAARAQMERQTWYDPELIAWRQRISGLHMAAERLGPDDPAAWVLLEQAAALEHEFRLLEVVTVWTPAGGV